MGMVKLQMSASAAEPDRFSAPLDGDDAHGLLKWLCRHTLFAGPIADL
jgi:hypothetical protein